MWAWALRTAVALGLDKWAKRKAADLIVKVEEAAAAKVAKLTAIQNLIAEPRGAGAGTAVFKAVDGLTYEVRVERRV